jgi:peptide/nickel transport system ATP-binding protein
MNRVIVSMENLAKRFTSSGRRVAALDDVSISLSAGETLGLVGTSGSGKSTLARVLMRLIPADAGEIRFDGIDWLALKGSPLRQQRARMQMVFQDTLGSFNPRSTVGAVIDDPLRIHSIVSPHQRSAEIAMLLERVGLSAQHALRPIRDLSGGQRQRVAIARAISTRPCLLVLDEAVSALDVTVRGRILDLLVELQKDCGIAYLFVSHDLAVVRAVSHRIAVMEAGRIVEIGAAADVIGKPRSDAARALIGAVPRLVTG